jgi:hypothetical protein
VPTAADLPGLDDVRLCGTDPFMAEKFGITGRQGLIEQLRRFVVEGGNIGDRNTAIQMIKNATGLGANPNPVAWADAKPGIYAVFLDNEHVVIGEVPVNTRAWFDESVSTQHARFAFGDGCDCPGYVVAKVLYFERGHKKLLTPAASDSTAHRRRK